MYLQRGDGVVVVEEVGERYEEGGGSEHVRVVLHQRVAIPGEEEGEEGEEEGEEGEGEEGEEEEEEEGEEGR